MKFSKKKIYILVLSLAAIASALAVYKNVYRFKPAPRGAVLNEDLGTPIETVSVKNEHLTHKLSYVGTIEAEDTVEISSKQPLEIVKLNIQDGDSVRSGQTIAELDKSSILSKLNTVNSKIETVKFNLEYLSDDVEKYKALYEGGSIPKNTYDKAVHEKDMLEMQLKELYASYDELNVSLNDTVLVSPVDGVVRKVNYSAGDLAMTAKPVAVIDMAPGSLVRANVTETDLKKIHEGTRVLLYMPGAKEPVESSVTNILPSVNPNTRVGEVEIKIGPKYGREYKAVQGSSIETEFIIDEVKDAMAIPSSCIKQLSDREVVYLIENGTAHEVPIKTGMRVDGMVQVTSGLTLNANLASENISKLYDGAKVYVFKGENAQ